MLPRCICAECAEAGPHFGRERRVRVAVPALIGGGSGAAVGGYGGQRGAGGGRGGRGGRGGPAAASAACCCVLLLMLLLVVYGALLTLRMKPQVAKVATVVRMKPRVP